jgi:microcystin-dependent protein
MAEYYLGQIMMTGFPFPQKGFAQCNGQLMAIQQSQALFSLLGTQYGGDGVRTFGLPNLQGATPVAAGASVDPAWQPSPYVVGEVDGVEQVTLLSSNMPIHNHTSAATTATAAGKLLTGAYFATTTVPPSGSENIYAPASGGQLTPLYSGTLSMSGNNQPHSNMQPFRVINFNIALSGVFPSRN